MNQTFNIFFDMDGVLAQYNPQNHIGKQLPFEQLGLHYFRTLPEDEDATALFYALTNEPNINLYVCSTISRSKKGKIGREQYWDKRVWCKEHIKTKNGVRVQKIITDKIMTDTSAINAIKEYINRPLTTNDILISANNNMLNAWKQAGGTAIKWINAYNNFLEWSGLKIITSQQSMNTIITNILREALYPHNNIILG